MTIEILFQDESIVAINKPSGMLVHRGWANDKVVAMTEVRDQIGQWVYPVHRLDRGSSGVVIFALSSEMASVLGKAFMNREVEKRYLALVRGVPLDEGTIEHAITKKEGGPKVDSTTHYRRIGVSGRYSVVEAIPVTGRLHQIRRHMKHISCPLIGDVKYGKGEHNRHFRDNYNLHRLALHCHYFALAHPVTGEPLQVRAPLAEDLASTFDALGIAMDEDVASAMSVSERVSD
ncbi:MAG: pseudouridylate synthase [Kofleriaceae bacterium]|nr:pseudouridylate synthase [Kofleriaceae bacterium]